MKVSAVVEVVPLVKSELSSLYRKPPPPPPPEVQVHVGVVLAVGLALVETVGATGAVVSTVIVIVREADQFPAASRSWIASE